MVHLFGFGRVSCVSVSYVYIIPITGMNQTTAENKKSHAEKTRMTQTMSY